MNTNIDIQKRAMIDALEKSLGVVTTACKLVGISRATHYKWCKLDADYKKAVDDIADIALDFVESKHYKNIEAGKETSIIFHLKTKGRKRGYQENMQIGGDSINPIKIQINVLGSDDPITEEPIDDENDAGL